MTKQARVFLTAEWKHLIMVNYEIDANILKSYLPTHTEIDYWNGKTYVSLVGFMFLNTKILGLPIPFHQNFEEVNLRFYVRYQHKREWRRGVTFIKEIVPKSAISFVANNLYKEKYISLPMKHSIQEEGEELKVQYLWKFQKEWNDVSVIAEKQSCPIQEGSEEEFIAEHYWGYTYLNENATSQYQVEHPPWEVFKVKSHQLNCNIQSLYGEEFIETFQQKPSSVFLAKGSEINVRLRGKLR